MVADNLSHKTFLVSEMSYLGLSGVFDLSDLFSDIYPKSSTLALDGSSNVLGIAQTNGQLLIGSTNNLPVAASLSAGSNGAKITNAPGSITIDIDSKADITANTLTATNGFIGPIKSAGDILPSTDNTYSVGSALLRWFQGFFSGPVTCNSTLSAVGITDTGTTTTSGIDVQGNTNVQGVDANTAATYDIGAVRNFRDCHLSRLLTAANLSLTSTTDTIRFHGNTNDTFLVCDDSLGIHTRTITIPSNTGLGDDTLALLNQNQTWGGANTFPGLTLTSTLSCGDISSGSGNSINIGSVVAGTTGVTSSGPINAGSQAITGGAGSFSSLNVSGLSGPNFVSVDAKGNLATADVSVENAMVSASSSGVLQPTTLASSNANGINSTLSFSGSTLTLNNSAQQDLSSTAAPTFAGLTTGTGGVTSSGGISNAITTGLDVSHVFLGNGPVNTAQSSVRLGRDDLSTIHPAFIYVDQTGTQSLNFASQAAASPWTGTTPDMILTASNLTVPALTSNGAIGAGTNAVTCGAITSSGVLTDTNTTDASSSTTGSVILSGGAGVAKSLYVGTSLNVGTSATAQTLTATNTTNQIVLGTTKTITISSTAPSSSLTYTLPDTKTAGDIFVLGSQLPSSWSAFGDQLTVVAGCGGSLAIQMNSNQAYGHSYNQLTPTSGDQMSIDMGTLQNKAYTLYILGLTNTDHGIMQVNVGVVNMGTLDWYSTPSPAVTNVLKSISLGTLSQGAHQLNLVMDGKNAGSSNYYWSITKMWIK